MKPPRHLAKREFQRRKQNSMQAEDSIVLIWKPSKRRTQGRHYSWQAILFPTFRRTCSATIPGTMAWSGKPSYVALYIDRGREIPTFSPIKDLPCKCRKTSLIIFNWISVRFLASPIHIEGGPNAAWRIFGVKKEQTQWWKAMFAPTSFDEAK